MEDGLRDANPLLVAARQISDRIWSLLGQRRCGNGVTQRLRAPPGINAVERGGIVEESDDSHFWIDRAVFRKIADARLGFAALRFHVIAVDRDQARAGFKEPRQQFHDCGLAGPVMTKEPDDLTISNCEAIAISPPADCGLGHAWGEWFPKAWISHSITHHEIHQRQAFWQSG